MLQRFPTIKLQTFQSLHLDYVEFLSLFRVSKQHKKVWILIKKRPVLEEAVSLRVVYKEQITPNIRSDKDSEGSDCKQHNRGVVERNIEH